MAHPGAVTRPTLVRLLDRCTLWIACLVFGASTVAIVVTPVLERGNVPYTSNFVTPTDDLVALAMYAVPVIGFSLIAIRPRLRTGWLMLLSGLALTLGLLTHAIAVRLLLVSAGTADVAGQLCAWLASWLLVLGFGLLPFVLATWPDGRIRVRFLVVPARVAVAALAAMAISEAFAPDHLDGVATGSSLPNPLGIDELGPALSAITAVGAVLLALFTGAVVVDALARVFSEKLRGKRRLVAVAGMGSLVLAAVAVGTPWGIPVLLVAAIPGIGVLLLVAARGMRRAEHAERERAAMVAEREDERRRLRRELHDGVGPLLAALRLELDQLPAGTGRARGLVAETLREVRRISRDLRPATLDEFGLTGALRHHAAILNVPGGPRIDIVTPALMPALPAAVEVAVLRIADEAMTNVVRHAQASSCRVELVVDGDVRLTVMDDGTGTLRIGEGAGLPSMRARAEELGGLFEVRPRPGGGTVAEAVFPQCVPRGGAS